MSLTLGRHPLALLRERLQRMRLIAAAELNRLPQGRVAHTASGVTFVTIEDETGCVNVVVWRARGAAAARAAHVKAAGHRRHHRA